MTIRTVSREFETIVEFDNVRLRIPDSFKSECKIPATNISLDGESVPDTEHYYSGVPLAGARFLNRHYYFTTSPFPLGKTKVARVRVETEQFPDGRKFTMLRIYVYATPRRAEFELKLRQEGADEGVPVEGTNTKIMFEKIEHKTVKAAETVAA